MAKLPHYALNFDALGATLAEFFSGKEEYKYVFEKENDTTHNIITSQGDSPRVT